MKSEVMRIAISPQMIPRGIERVGSLVSSARGATNSMPTKLQKANAQVVLCSLTSLGEKHDGTNRIDAKLEELAEVARVVAKEQKIPLNDLRKAFVAYWKEHNPDNKPSGLLTYDGNHFNQKGMEFVAEQMLKKFK